MTRVLAIAATLIVVVSAACPPAMAQVLQAVVTTRVVHPGEVLSASDLRIVEVRNPTPVARPVVRSLPMAVGQVARRTLLPRRYIARSALRAPHAVEAGTRVELRYARGSLAITTDGTALASASRGALVTVRVAGGHLVTGTAASAGVVEVSP